MVARLQRIINENSLVPLSLVIALLGGAGWLTMVYANGMENGRAIVEIKSDSAKAADVLMRVERDVSYIRGFIEAEKKRGKDNGLFR